MCRRFILLVLLSLSFSVFAQKEQQVVITHTDAQGRTITLAGTFTTPDGKAPRGGWPAVVLITGSGSQNRDEELLGHKPFKVIADSLAAQGIATLRCDDRGVGGSTGAFPDITPYDLVADIQAQWQWLAHAKKINPKQIGLLGHSEGGMLAPMAAVENPEVAFVVMLAGPAVTMKQVLLDQNQKIFLQKGIPDTLVARRLDFMRDVFAASDSLAADTAQLVKRMTQCFRKLKDLHTQGLTKEQKQSVGLTSAECYGWAVTMAQPYMRSSLSIVPADYLSRMVCPLYALNGELDCQVDAQSNLEAVRQARPDKSLSTRVWMCPGMNHLFQHSQTGAVEEYQQLGQSPDSEVLHSVADWIHSLFR